jgi:hypothetical protein
MLKRHSVRLLAALFMLLGLVGCSPSPAPATPAALPTVTGAPAAPGAGENSQGGIVAPDGGQGEGQAPSVLDTPAPAYPGAVPPASMGYPTPES